MRTAAKRSVGRGRRFRTAKTAAFDMPKTSAGLHLAVLQSVQQFYDTRNRIGEKFFISLAEAAFSKRLHVGELPVTAASAAAEAAQAASQAFRFNTQGGADEANGIFLPIQIIKTVSSETSKAIGIQHIEIAWVYAAVCFYHVLIDALAAHAAVFWWITEQHPR